MHKNLIFSIIIFLFDKIYSENIEIATTIQTNTVNYYDNITIDENTSTRDKKTFYGEYILNETNYADDFDYTDHQKKEKGEKNEFIYTTEVNTYDYDNEDDSNEKCQFATDLFILHGQIVRASISSGIPAYMWVEICKPPIRVDTIFNMSMTVDVPELYLRRVKWPSFPESAIVEKADLSGVMPIGLWGGCSKLTEISIESSDFSLTSPDWLAKCTRLTTLAVKDMSLSKLKFVLDSVPRVKQLYLRTIHGFEKIVFIHIFPSARGAHQWISKLTMDDYGLKYKDIENGIVTADEMSASFIWQLSLMPKLEDFTVLHFSYFDFCVKGNLSSVTLQSLKHLMLYKTNTNSMCFKKTRIAPQLTSLNLAQTNINELQFGELFSKPSPQLIVSLELARIQQFIFVRADYLALIEDAPARSNVTLDRFEFSIDCNCGQSLWFARALLEGIVTAPGVNCRDGTALEDQNCDWLHCERVPCNDECVCCEDEPGTVVGDCRDANISELPAGLLRWTNLTSLVVSYNNLTQLPVSLPTNLKWLDLSGNDVFRTSREAEISALFAAPDRHVLLFGNPIICSCDTQPLIRILHDHKEQIEDYGSLICAGDNTKLSTVNVPGLCTLRNRQKSILLIISLFLIAAILSLITSLGFYYRKSIQIYLFARGWCLFCINEEELDCDRQYDVFLSFCYEDDIFVLQELLPVLDREYSVCIHYRDWSPGDMIPSQITKSVEQARRTIVVLSRSFIQSLWGLLEFRTAHVTGLVEGRVRVVMIVLDDILEDEDLEAEIKSYVRLNTYVKWGDPWFWDKLRFALPHRPSPNVRNINSERLANFANEQFAMIELPPDNDTDRR